MLCCKLLLSTAVTFAIACAIPASAEIVYTQVRVSLPANQAYGIDLNGDGTIDFTATSKLLQAYCLSGDEFIWNLTVTPAARNAVVVDSRQTEGTFAAALMTGARIDASQHYGAASPLAAEIFWGSCGIGSLGDWINLPNRYLGLKFYTSDHTLHYGWAKLSTVAYVDPYGSLQSNTMISGFAFETTPGQQIMAGQRFETP